MVSVQEYLDKYYPRVNRSSVLVLDISKEWDTPDEEKLTGSLNLVDFINLECLNCTNNNLTDLIIDNCWNLKQIFCSENRLTNSNFLSNSNSKRLNRLGLANNNFSAQSLVIFAPFVNLERLWIGNDNEERIKQGIYNRWYGSLEPLKNMTNLQELCIEGTDIDSGLEYLPDSLNEAQYDTDPNSHVVASRRVFCSSKKRFGSKVVYIKEQLKSFGYNLGKWKENYRKRLEREQEGNFTMNQLVLTEK